METTQLLDPDQWAERTFGPVLLGDWRRTRRAVKAACGLARDPAASLPKSQQTWNNLKAMYRLLDESDVTFEALMQPHWCQTRTTLQREVVVLLVQDTTEIDLSDHIAMSGLSQIGNAKGRGFLLQTVLAVHPQTQGVLGCLAQRPFLRIPAPPKEQRYQRRHRTQRETDIWMQMVEQIGTPASAGWLVHVGDRGADMLPFFRKCLEPKRISSFVRLRTAESRLESTPSGICWITYVLGRARASSPLTCPPVMDARPGRRRSKSALDQPPCCLPGMTRVGAKTPCPSGWCASGKPRRLRARKRLNGCC